MNKNLLLAIIGFVFVAFAILIVTPYGQGAFSKALSYFSKGGSAPEGIILFYGEGCTHCKTVEDFISESKIEDKVKFTRLEVFYNQENANLVIQKATECKVDITQGVPVPFLWDGKNCTIGDQDIINFFSKYK